MKIDQAYNIWAQTYDNVENKTRDLEKLALQKTLGKYEFSDVVEIGCGTGKNTKWLMDKAQSIVGVDFSENMLEKAKKKIQSDKIQFIKQDITTPWDLKKDSADLISCSLTLEHIENLDFIFNQGFRVLRNGGRFYLCELHPFKQYTGSKAKFEKNNEIEDLDVFVHHVSDYVISALDNGFKIVELNEWFDEAREGEKPRLISFVFEKKE